MTDELDRDVTGGQAKDHGITSAMLIRWSRDGLVSPVGRTVDGHLLYTLAELCKLRDAEPPRPGSRN